MSNSLEERRTVELSGRTLTLTPLSLFDMQVLEDLGEALRKGEITPRESIIQTAEIIFRSAQIADPSLTSDAVKRCLTLRNFGRATQALMQVTGLVAEDEPAEKKRKARLRCRLGGNVRLSYQRNRMEFRASRPFDVEEGNDPDELLEQESADAHHLSGPCRRLSQRTSDARRR